MLLTSFHISSTIMIITYLRVKETKTSIYAVKRSDLNVLIITYLRVKETKTGVQP